MASESKTQTKINVKKWEYYSASIIWYTTYTYILIMAMIELNSNYKDRFTQRRLMRASYLPDFIKKINFGNFYPFSDR